MQFQGPGRTQGAGARFEFAVSFLCPRVGLLGAWKHPVLYHGFSCDARGLSNFKVDNRSLRVQKSRLPLQDFSLCLGQYHHIFAHHQRRILCRKEDPRLRSSGRQELSLKYFCLQAINRNCLRRWVQLVCRSKLIAGEEGSR